MKLLKTPEDIGIVACVFEDLSKFLSSHVLQMSRKFTDVNTYSIKKYACTAEYIVKRLGVNIEVFVHEEQNAIIYRFIKV